MPKSAVAVDTLGNPEPPKIEIPNILLGQTVIYHELYGKVPAFVQKIYEPGLVRLWVLGAQSVYPKDGAYYGTETGQWSLI